MTSVASISQSHSIYDVEDRLCGVKPFTTTKRDPFYQECVRHDIGYEKGGDKATRKATDSAFYSGIWKKAKENPILIPRATFYTAAVAAVGRWIWDYKK